jgi:hypothetical protein
VSATAQVYPSFCAAHDLAFHMRHCEAQAPRIEVSLEYHSVFFSAHPKSRHSAFSFTKPVAPVQPFRSCCETPVRCSDEVFSLLHCLLWQLMFPVLFGVYCISLPVLSMKPDSFQSDGKILVFWVAHPRWSLYSGLKAHIRPARSVSQYYFWIWK